MGAFSWFVMIVFCLCFVVGVVQLVYNCTTPESVRKWHTEQWPRPEDRQEKDRKQREVIQTLPAEYQTAVQELQAVEYWVDSAKSRQKEKQERKQQFTDVTLKCSYTDYPPYGGIIIHDYWILISREQEQSFKQTKKPPKKEEATEDEFNEFVANLPKQLRPAVLETFHKGFKAYIMRSSKQHNEQTHDVLLRRQTVTPTSDGKQLFDTDEYYIYYNHTAKHRQTQDN